ncbi:MerR family transcriptional regulator [Nocardiopsis mangrovi]|uniref:MerR family transcriptional regulator n=1 Tax=Nocardiopsis mangrovi TaxID=1179818 RepID=A0ABV9E2F4_9ACTN
MDRDGRTWKVGELARATGLTVRTLHHYEHIGVVPPSARTAAGHRVYDADDVRRLYRVVALRAFGLPLETIRLLLDGRLDLIGLLRDHAAHVDARLEALRVLRTRLGMVLRTAEETGDFAPDDLLSLIEGVSDVNDTMGRYFSEEQLGALRERREQRGEDAVAAEIAEWPRLIGLVQAEMDAGTDPADPRVRDLARRWTALLEAFHGGDPALRDSLYRMRAENSEEVRTSGGPSEEMIAYIGRATAAG